MRVERHFLKFRFRDKIAFFFLVSTMLFLSILQLIKLFCLLCLLYNIVQVETLWAHRCWQDPDCVKEAVALFNLCFPGSKNNNLELFGSTPSHLKQTLLVCIQKQGDLNAHNLKLLPSLLDNAPRRNLASSTHVSSPPHAKKSASSAKGKEDHQKTIIIAVVTTAVSTLLLAACLFLCCTKVCGKGSGSRINDERPLLSLSSNEYSLGNTTYYSPLSNLLTYIKQILFLICFFRFL